MRRIKLISQRQHGQTLVEVLIAIALSGILLPTLATALITSRDARPQTLRQQQALTLLREADEAVRVVREKNWAGIASVGIYHPVISVNSWSLTTGSEDINGFTRQIDISNVNRNSSGAIVATGGTLDPSTKDVVVTVTWETPYHLQVSNETYLTRWQNDTTWTQTTQSDFNGGVLTNTATTNTSGGEVQLASTPSSINWASPSFKSSLDLAGTGNDVFVAPHANGKTYAYLGYATGLAVIDVTNPAAPSLTGTYAASAAVNGVYVSGGFAYLAIASTTTQLLIVNISNPASPALTKSLKVGSSAGSALYGLGSYIYMGDKVNSSAAEFFAVDCTTPTAPVVNGSIEVSADVNAVKVPDTGGNYVYLATGGTTKQLTVVNATTRSTPTIAGTYTAGAAAGLDVAVNGTVAYLASASSTAAEVFAINVGTPTAPTLRGSFEAGGAVNGIAISSTGNEALLATAVSTKQFEVLDITPNNPTFKSGVALSAAANDIFAANDYAYLGTADTTKDFQIIGPAITPGGFQTNGTFESSVFNPGASVAFNYFTFNPLSQPAGTTLKFQVATSLDNATWSAYEGPDGTTATYYTAADDLPLNIAKNNYFRYKTYFTGNGTATPVLQGITLNYSP